MHVRQFILDWSHAHLNSDGFCGCENLCETDMGVNLGHVWEVTRRKPVSAEGIPVAAWRFSGAFHLSGRFPLPQMVKSTAHGENNNTEPTLKYTTLCEISIRVYITLVYINHREISIRVYITLVYINHREIYNTLWNINTCIYHTVVYKPQRNIQHSVKYQYVYISHCCILTKEKYQYISVSQRWNINILRTTKYETL